VEQKRRQGLRFACTIVISYYCREYYTLAIVQTLPYSGKFSLVQIFAEPSLLHVETIHTSIDQQFQGSYFRGAGQISVKTAKFYTM
jgi:hypothetical protein